MLCGPCLVADKSSRTVSLDHLGFADGSRRMAHYFFHIHLDEVISDPEGIDLPSHSAAMMHALLGARSLAAADAETGWLTLDHFILVTDDQQNPVGSVRIGDAVTIV